MEIKVSVMVLFKVIYILFLWFENGVLVVFVVIKLLFVW